MKRALILACAAAVTCVSGAASAIDTFGGPRPIQVVGLPELILGTAEFTALGRAGHYCRYLMTWESPYNQNDATICDVRERRTLLSPSCTTNRRGNVPTIALAGPETAVDTFCSGFDLLGQRIDTGDISLILASGGKYLTGIVIYPWGMALPVEIT
jgi:hypothetical protein